MPIIETDANIQSLNSVEDISAELSIKSKEYADILNKEVGKTLDGIPISPSDVLPILEVAKGGESKRAEMLVQGLISSKNAMSTGQKVAMGSSIATEAGVGMAGQALGLPAGPAGVSTGGMIAAGAGNILGQGIRQMAGLQDEFSKGQFVGSLVAGAIPIAPAEAGASSAMALFKNLRNNELTFALSEGARTFIDENRAPNAGELLNPYAQTLIAGLSALGAAGQAYKNREAKLEELRSVGIDTRNAPQSLLTNSPIAARLDAEKAASDLDTARRFQQSFGGLEGGIKDWILPKTSSAELAERIRPSIDKIDTLQAELIAANKTLDLLTEDLARVSSGTRVDKNKVLAAQVAASEAVNIRLQKQMEALHYATIDPSETLNASAGARTWSDTVVDLFEKQKEVTDSMYDMVGLKGERLLTNANQLADEVEAKLSPLGNRNDIKQAVEIIRESAQMESVVDESGKVSQVVKEGDNLDNGQLMEMKQNIYNQLNSNAIAVGAPSTISDSVLEQIYNIIKARRLDSVAKVGIDPAKLTFADANYAKLINMRNNKYAKVLLDASISDSTIASLADEAANGQLQNIENAYKFAGQVSPQAKVAFQSIVEKTLRDSLINKAFNQATLNKKSFNANLSNLVLRANSNLKKSPALRGVDLGFGGSEEIKQWNYVFNTLDPKNLSKAEIRDLFKDPIARNAISSGNPAVLKSRVAMRIYKAEVRKQYLEETAGIKKTAIELKAEENRLKVLARDAGESRDIAAEALAEAKKDPFIVYMQGKGRFGVTEKVGDGANSLVDNIFHSGEVEAKRFMSALKQSDENSYNLVMQELRTKTFNTIVEDLAAKGFYSNDYSRITAAFHDKNPDARIHILRAVSSPEEFAAFTKTAKIIDLITRNQVNAKFSSKDSVVADVFAVLMGGAGMAQGHFSTGMIAKSFGNKLLDAANKTVFSTWTHILGDRKTAHALAYVMAKYKKFNEIYTPVQQYNMLKHTPEVYRLFTELDGSPEEKAYNEEVYNRAKKFGDYLPQQVAPQQAQKSPQ